MQSRAEVVPLRRGDGVVFAVCHRPVERKRGPYRVNMKHGVSRLRSGASPDTGDHLPRREVIPDSVTIPITLGIWERAILDRPPNR